MISPWLIQTCRFEVENLWMIHCPSNRAYLLSHLASNMGQSLLAIEAHRLQSAVPKHLGDLSVLLSIFSEHQFSFVILVLVLSSSAIFTTLINQWGVRESRFRSGDPGDMPGVGGGPHLSLVLQPKINELRYA